ncbi:glycoside hydrolase family 5 protein [Xylariaceae sp. FL0804]|nr:glycoside hydrolase family 5 protein [Xylariaceae sp. FL0804]
MRLIPEGATPPFRMERLYNKTCVVATLHSTSRGAKTSVFGVPDPDGGVSYKGDDGRAAERAERESIGSSSCSALFCFSSIPSSKGTTMKFTEVVTAAATVAGVLAVPRATPPRKRASGFQFVGVSESGAEFGSTALPGELNKDYTFPNTSAIQILINKGMNTFRIPMLMERFTPNNLTGPVNETYAAGLDSTVKYITDAGAYAIVDAHNYGRFYGDIITDVAAFGDWWTTMASRYRNNSRVIFDINNEYHDEDNALVASLNQQAIDAIRATGATSQYIFAEGNSWTGAWTWVSSGTDMGMGNLTDPVPGKLVYEMHQYLDSDGSGTSATCVNGSIGQERIEAATQWLKQTGKVGIIGETAGGANAVCVEALQGMLGYMQNNTDVWSGWLWWGAGPWWGDYIYGMEPPSGTAYLGVLPSLMAYV